MTDPTWTPGDPIYKRPSGVTTGGHIRPIFQLMSDCSMLRGTRGWCDPCEVWSIRSACWWCGRDLSDQRGNGYVMCLSSDAAGTATDPVATYA